MPDVRNLGSRLKAYRLSHGLTQTQLAVLLKVGRQTVNRIENGGTPSDLTRGVISRLLQGAN